MARRGLPRDVVRWKRISVTEGRGDGTHSIGCAELECGHETVTKWISDKRPTRVRCETCVCVGVA